MFEDMIRAAKKENSEIIKKYSNYPPPSPPLEHDTPQKWYEKKWGVGLALILFFPIGIILLLKNPRFSNGAKFGITAAAFLLPLVYDYVTYEPPVQSRSSAYVQNNNISSSSSYDVGYLRQGASWSDESGRMHHNSKKVKVEIWKQKINMADGSEMIQIYFLGGENAGSWGYVRESSLSR